MKTKLTAPEQAALTWAKSVYPHWRKRFGETLEEHMARRGGIAEELWRHWYNHPFGNPEFNARVQIVRSLLLAKRV